MYIRAHHILCIQGFQGYGYSKDFVDNMTELTENINSNPDLKIEIIDECDIICSRCPYNNGGICQKRQDSFQKVRDTDLRVLKKLGLKKGMKLKAKDIFFLANEKLKNISDIQDICGDCEWKEICNWFISRKNNGLS